MKIGRKPIQMLNKNKNFNTSIFNWLLSNKNFSDEFAKNDTKYGK